MKTRIGSINQVNQVMNEYLGSKEGSISEHIEVRGKKASLLNELFSVDVRTQSVCIGGSMSYFIVVTNEDTNLCGLLIKNGEIKPDEIIIETYELIQSVVSIEQSTYSTSVTSFTMKLFYDLLNSKKNLKKVIYESPSKQVIVDPYFQLKSDSWVRHTIENR